MVGEFCPRLVDYIVLVGSHSTNRTSSSIQTPVILNRFPPTDHEDFILPPDVALFCQPEGCFNVVGSRPARANSDSSTPVRMPISFVFTLTDKESNKVRYGVCLNFLRPIPRRPEGRKHSTSSVPGFGEMSRRTSDMEFSQLPPPRNADRRPEDTGLLEKEKTQRARSSVRLRTHTLTSLCLVTHHPFFTKFRALVEFLHTLIHKLHERSRSKQSDRETVWGVLAGGVPSTTSSLVIRSVQEIEIWMLRLLSAPAPVPGKTCVHLAVQPKALMKPLVFALPDKSRLPLVDFPLHLPIQLLGISRTLRILVCLLLEQKVVLQSSDYNKLSICVLALTALLYPLQYMFPIIPLLPPCMPDAEQLLIAPTPYIIGVPTSFYTARKVFRMPKDVWVANLDTQQLSYPEVMEVLPDLPEAECHNIVRHLNDVLFLNSRNILGGLPAHTRTLRLYPRPVVAFQFDSFMKSRPQPCLFTSMLAKTQAVEYFAESSLCAMNEAYQRIIAGEYAPEVIGDKAEWFSSLLSPVHFDVWPDLVGAGGSDVRSSRTSLSADFTGSPLLYALVAARLHLATSANVQDGTAEGHISNLLGQLPTSISLPDEVSDYPTDESASDTETEHSTASVTSTLSDLASDCFDSGIGAEFHHKCQQIDADLDRTRDTTDLTAPGPDQSSLLTDPVTVRPGEPLPAALRAHFNPPSQPALGLSDNSGASDEEINLNGHDKVSSNESPEAEDNENSVSSTVSVEGDRGLTGKDGYSRPGDMSTTQTLRTLTRLSVSMFSGGSSSPDHDPDQRKRSVISDGRINWGSPFFVLLGELFNMNSSEAESLQRNGEVSKEYKRRLEDDRYILSVAKSIRDGSLPGFFSRNRVISMMESENHRNLILSRLNEPNMSAALNDVTQQYIDDVPLETWNQYKALVWILQQIAFGLEMSLRSDIFIPTPSNAHLESSIQRSSRSTVPPVQPNNGGLASAFTLLELAHTHFFPLPIRQDRGTRGFMTPGPDSNSTLSRNSLSSATLSAISDLRSPPPSENNDTSGVNSPSPESIQSDMISDGSGSHFGLSSATIDHYQRSTPVLLGLPQQRGPDSSKHSPALKSPMLLLPNIEKLRSTSSSSASLSHTEAIKRQDTSISDGLVLTPKSVRTRGYRYIRSRLVQMETSNSQSTNALSVHRHSLAESDMKDLLHQSNLQTQRTRKPRTGRTYVFEDLVNESGRRNKLWDDMQFWEDAFLDAVAQERDILGMDFRPTELLTRYNLANPLKKKHLELAEDRLLAGLMHNLISFMVMLEVSLPDIRKKVRRLLAKSHMGLHYSQEISHLLDVLEYLAGNDIDLKTIQSRTIPLRSYEVRWGTDDEGELAFIEVCDDCLLLRSLSGAILDRWWYDQLINITHRPHTHILGISIRMNGQSHLNLFYSKRCQQLYHEIQRAVELASLQTHRGPLVTDLGGELNVVCMESQRPGTIKLFPDGFFLKFGNQKKFISIPNIKRCSAPQPDLFVLDYFDRKKQCLCSNKFQTDMALPILSLWHRLLTVAITRRHLHELNQTAPVHSQQKSSYRRRTCSITFTL
ncbi:MAP kinase-activating death domain protein, variant 3 [Clonorchis sinensis]|uniref:MAP kinase-activating death domain protein n=1 Tax=Clonorchis sinensis TaxID=79923 RepID=A0A8T1MTC6_CLOSI|nr:MAP kinase-activating death domain protein, variant 3 [Clonorchis sinensis]